jgi:hypothetical protein
VIGFSRAVVVGNGKENKTVFSIVELKTMTLDYGIPGFSPTLVLLLFALMFAIGMIPYALLYVSLRDKKVAEAVRVSHAPGFARRIAAWVHVHRHPALLHH